MSFCFGHKIFACLVTHRTSDNVGQKSSDDLWCRLFFSQVIRASCVTIDPKTKEVIRNICSGRHVTGDLKSRWTNINPYRKARTQRPISLNDPCIWIISTGFQCNQHIHFWQPIQVVSFLLMQPSISYLLNKEIQVTCKLSCIINKLAVRTKTLKLELQSKCGKWKRDHEFNNYCNIFTT